MIAKEVEETLFEAFEAFLREEKTIFSPIYRIMTEQKHHLIHDLEKLFSIALAAVQSSLHPSEQKIALMEELHAMIEILRHGFIQPSAMSEQKPVSFANFRAAFFSKVSKEKGFSRGRSLRR